MGSYNGTCGLTHLPITAGTKVRGYILKPNKYSNPKDTLSSAGPTYSTDLFTPMSWSIKGEYDDYGGMENIVIDDNTMHILSFFNEKLKAKTITIDDTDEFDTIEKLVNSILQGSSDFGFMMVIESAFDATIAGYETTLHEKYDSSKFMANVLEDLRLAQNHIRVTDAPVGLKETLSKLNIKSAEEDPIYRHLGYLTGMKFPKRPDADTYMDNITSSFLGLSSYRDSLICSEYSNEHFKKIIKQPNASLKDIANHYIYCCIMSSSRRTWISQCGQGSQCEEYKLHRIIAEATIAIVNEVKAEHAESTDLDDPDELSHHNKSF